MGTVLELRLQDSIFPHHYSLSSQVQQAKEMSSPTSNNRRKSKAAWSNEDDIRLCRAFVLATQDSDGTEHVKNMWTRVYTHYAKLVDEEDPGAAPRAGGALQTHWSSFIRPESSFFMSLLVKVEKEEHEGWKEEDFIMEAKHRFETIRQAEEAETLRAYRESTQQAILENTEPPAKPKTKATTFRYAHCIPVLKTSNRFMRAVLSEKKTRVARSPTQKRRGRRPKLPSDADEMMNGSEASYDSAELQGKASPKRRKESVASSAASASASASSSSSSSDDSSDDGAPMPKGVASVAAPVATPSQTVQLPIAQESRIPHANTQNGSYAAKAQVVRSQRSQQKANYRLKLLAELRGIVETISQLANQLENGTAAPMGMAAGSRLDPTLAEEVQQDLRFFREQKLRLKHELDALDASEVQS
ncbi:hypothetical protein F441_04955 [Phytophthora nicotianae CJ01A1]|uniref:No apical meristem-associated C-terminal domain-containing protein n=5 Tax=Phytophthora nicotianae TaxID=4792 RepID=W2QGL4_PHYN3|nr:hypothetical protein PPTG_09179 [Phytophthora nicotianae INRA-310]ETI51774.1 hypothetical protein F443_04951 [Phytophthora nicotianae P1569]ETK91649.1 hypothetical protein L915_04819 [Phytophthora nicotianae]ETO80528.1 hypothetical protein F444_04997 [Phytophthora nicotianae P1976]ETP21561.1 hypothetical protein F441_04955 [Phytophthora nicotianae CJ01A1]ETL45060.1 hypothetical protein L916_04765 [Phytophthora nicotianae]